MGEDSSKNHLLESISTQLKWQDVYFQMHCTFFPLLCILKIRCQNSWVLPLSFLGMWLFFTTNVKRVEKLWFKTFDSCSLAQQYIRVFNLLLWCILTCINQREFVQSIQLLHQQKVIVFTKMCCRGSAGDLYQWRKTAILHLCWEVAKWIWG